MVSSDDEYDHDMLERSRRSALAFMCYMTTQGMLEGQLGAV